MRNVQTTPTAIRVEELEGGAMPPQNYIRLGPHICLYPLSLYHADAREVGQPDPLVEAVLVPACSVNHPSLDRWLGQGEGLGKSRGGTPRVLIRTRKFGRRSKIPLGPTKQGEITGLVVTDLHSLEEKERKLLAESWPDWNLDDVVIVEEGSGPDNLYRGALVLPIGITLVAWGVWNIRRMALHYSGRGKGA
jgi:hypothetical protein